MVYFTDLYQCIDQLSIWYVSSCTEHTDTLYMGVYQCTTYTRPLSDWYVSPIPSDMSRYDEPYYKLHISSPNLVKTLVTSLH